jgi:DNA primase
VCGKYKTAIVVEDCASACAVSEHYTGFALMGTNFSDEFIPYIKKYSKVIVALDRDATTKSFDIANKIGYYVPTEVKILKDDLKYFKPDEIKEILNG